MELGADVLARTANLNDTRVASTATDAWAAVMDASNPGRHRTDLRLTGAVEGAEIGDWVGVVDYVVGDTVLYEPTGSSEIVWPG